MEFNAQLAFFKADFAVVPASKADAKVALGKYKTCLDSGTKDKALVETLFANFDAMLSMLDDVESTLSALQSMSSLASASLEVSADAAEKKAN